MRSPAPTSLRGVRAAVLGSAVLLLACAAHVLGGGPLPAWPLLVGAGIPTACAAVVAARRVRGIGAILGFLAVGQLALHQVFMTAAAAPSCAPAPSGAMAHTGHAMSAVACGAIPAMGSHALPSALMLAAHAVALLATAALLAHGERVALRLWTWAQPRVSAALPVAPAVVRTGLAFLAPQLTAQRIEQDDASRRGPPRLPVPVLSLA